MNWEIIIATILLHDIGKMDSYKCDFENKRYVYTEKSKKIPHLDASFAQFIEFANLYDLDENLKDDIGHCILAHHGRKEWGSPVEPLNAEAMFVHLVDMISSRCTAFRDEMHPMQ